MDILSLIVKSNTFNFIIFMLIIILVAKKIDVDGMLTSMQERIKKVIEDSKKAKEDSVLALKNSEDAVKNVENEVKTIIEEAENTAVRLGKKILEDAEKQVLSIESNTQKIIEAEGKKVNSSLSRKTSLASYELAKKHIIETLKDKVYLHGKFINNSIDELDRLKF